MWFKSCIVGEATRHFHVKMFELGYEQSFELSEMEGILNGEY